jgi:hypothetical protein
MKAEALIERYPAIAAATTRLREFNSEEADTRRYAAQATKAPTIAMLKQFAPRVVIPPSPKKSA